jgi:hypothetical protein
MSIKITPIRPIGNVTGLTKYRIPLVLISQILLYSGGSVHNLSTLTGSAVGPIAYRALELQPGRTG